MSEVWWVAADRRAALEAYAPLDLVAWMASAPAAGALSSDRGSAAVRLGGDPPLLVKWRRPRAGHRRRHFLRASRERREAHAMRHARRLGIPCPTAWAVAERRHAGMLEGSLLVRPFDDGARTGLQAAREDLTALDDLARSLRGWHDLGFRHGDCYPKNVLLGGAAGAPRPIGCPGARFRPPGPRLDRWRWKDLAQFAVGCWMLAPHDDPFRTLAAYAREPGLPAVATLRARVAPFHARIMRRKEIRRITRPAREPDGPPLPVALDPATAPARRIVVRELDTEAGFFPRHSTQR